MNDKQITAQEKHDAAVQLYNAFKDIKDASGKIPVSDVLSENMLYTLKAIVNQGLEEWAWK